MTATNLVTMSTTKLILKQNILSLKLSFSVNLIENNYHAFNTFVEM